jgi:hypothetical protein
VVAGIVTRTRVCLGDSPDLLLIVMHRGVLDLCSRTGTVAAQAGGIVPDGGSRFGGLLAVPPLV